MATEPSETRSAYERLNPRQRRFVDAYLAFNLNATRAAVEAGYSEESARTQGWKLMRDPLVREAIQEKLDQRSLRTQITADRVLLEVARSAFVDIGELFDERGRLKPIGEIGEDTRRAIASIKVKSSLEPGDEPVEVYTTEIKFNDKLKANELLGRHLTIFKDKVELEAGETLAELVLAATKRASQP